MFHEDKPVSLEVRFDAPHNPCPASTVDNQIATNRPLRDIRFIRISLEKRFDSIFPIQLGFKGAEDVFPTVKLCSILGDLLEQVKSQSSISNVALLPCV